MPERRFDTGYWNDPDIMKLPMKAKLLYLYLWTNRHCNQAGLYEIAPETIQWETGLALGEIADLLQLLEKKVAWYPDQNLVWVKNFLHRQSQSPKFLAAAAKCLKNITNNGLVRELIAYNERYTLSIPYPYPIDTLSIPSSSSSLSHANAYALSDSISNKVVSLFGSFSLLRNRLRQAASGSIDRLVEYEEIKQELSKMGHEQGLDVQSEWQTEEGRIDLCWLDSDGKLVAAFEVDVHQSKEKSLLKLSVLDCPVRCIILRTGDTPYHLEKNINIIGLGGASDILAAEDQEIISVWREVRGFMMEMSAMVELLQKIRMDFPDVDILSESRKWSVSKLAYPLGKASNPSSQIYNFMAKRHEWNQQKRHGQRKESFPEVHCECGYTGPDVGHKTCPLCHQPYEKESKGSKK